MSCSQNSQISNSQLTVDTNLHLRLTNKYIKHVVDARFGMVLANICRQSSTFCEGWKFILVQETHTQTEFGKSKKCKNLDQNWFLFLWSTILRSILRWPLHANTHKHHFNDQHAWIIMNIIWMNAGAAGTHLQSSKPMHRRFYDYCCRLKSTHYIPH